MKRKPAPATAGVTSPPADLHRSAGRSWAQDEQLALSQLAARPVAAPSPRRPARAWVMLMIAAAATVWGLSGLLSDDTPPPKAPALEAAPSHTGELISPFGRLSANDQAATLGAASGNQAAFSFEVPQAPKQRSPEVLARLQQALLTIHTSDAVQLGSNLDLLKTCPSLIYGDHEAVQPECDQLRRAAPAMRAMLNALAASGNKEADLRVTEFAHSDAMSRFNAAFMSGAPLGPLAKSVMDYQDHYTRVASELNRPELLQSITMLSFTTASDQAPLTAPP